MYMENKKKSSREFSIVDAKEWNDKRKEELEKQKKN